MDINTIDDLLKYLSEYSEIRLYDNTKELERSIVLDAVEKKLLYNSSSNVYKLDGLGNEVVMSRLSWVDFQAKKKADEDALVAKAVDYIEAKKNNPNAIGYTDKPLPFGGIYPDSKPFFDEGFQESQKQIEREQWENYQPFQKPLETKKFIGQTTSIEEVKGKSSIPKTSSNPLVKILQHWFFEKYVWTLLLIPVAWYITKSLDGQENKAGNSNIKQISSPKVEAKNQVNGNINSSNVLVGDNNVGENTTIINKTTSAIPIAKPFIQIYNVETVKQPNKFSVYLSLNALKADVFNLKGKIFMITRTFNDSLIYDGEFNPLKIKRLLLDETVTVTRSADIINQDTNFKNFYFYLKGSYSNEAGKSFPLEEFSTYSFERKALIIPSEKEEAWVKSVFKANGIK